MTRLVKVGYVFGLAANAQESWYQHYYRKIAAKDIYGSEYLEKVPQEF